MMKTPITKAMILAAGRGKRMRELTDDRPKPMIAVQGKPILEHIVTGLRDAGVTEVLIVTGYKAEMIEQYFQNGDQSCAIHYVRQEVQDGTGRVVELGKDFTGDETFVLSYGDILVGPETYVELLQDRPEADGVISVKRDEDVSKGGAVFMDEAGYLTDLREKPQPGEATSPWYNAGLYVFPSAIYEFTAKLEKSPRGEYELTDAIRDLGQHPDYSLAVMEITGQWADVRDPEVLADLNQG